MTATTEHRKLTQAELVAEARERFGTDPLKWAFACPSCGDIANGADFSEALTKHPRAHVTGDEVIASDILGVECIGRTLGALKGPQNQWKGRGCDWVAYGLFAGPWEIQLPDGRTKHAFPLAPAPC
ncbi:VVA0879 family protein [Streptomyces sp. NPDC020298]|uniref:VVA0879 family protein n=1 Tax=unclassified Streptomyces TaxID=2593676 RepID=UPI0033D97D8B